MPYSTSGLGAVPVRKVVRALMFGPDGDHGITRYQRKHELLLPALCTNWKNHQQPHSCQELA